MVFNNSIGYKKKTNKQTKEKTTSKKKKKKNKFALLYFEAPVMNRSTSTYEEGCSIILRFLYIKDELDELKQKLRVIHIN